MKYFFRYFHLSTKRAFNAFPAVMLLTLILCTGVILTSLIITKVSEDDDSRQRVKVGVVGDMADSYLGVGLNALRNIDDSRFLIELFQLPSEEEAKKLLEASDISSYILIPDGFVDSIISGENAPLTYVLKRTSAPLGAILMSEVATSVSSIITESQTGVAAVQEYCLDLGMDSDSYQVGDEANLEYISAILERSKLIDKEITGGTDALGLYAQIFCGAVTFFLMLLGITCSSLLVRRENAVSFERLAQSRWGRRGAITTVIGDWISFFALAEAILVILALIGGIALSQMNVSLPEFRYLGTGDLLIFALRIIPAAMALTALEFLLFEITEGVVGSILLQFTVAAALGYISGCFYPMKFFPESVQRVSELLPSGAALTCVRQAFSSSANPSVLNILLLFGYSAAALAAAAAIRAIKTKRC